MAIEILTSPPTHVEITKKLNEIITAINIVTGGATKVAEATETDILNLFTGA